MTLPSDRPSDLGPVVDGGLEVRLTMPEPSIGGVGERSAAVGGDNLGIVSTGNDAINVQVHVDQAVYVPGPPLAAGPGGVPSVSGGLWAWVRGREAPVNRLDRSVRAQWSVELVHRGVTAPRPLRLRWLSTVNADEPCPATVEATGEGMSVVGCGPPSHAAGSSESEGERPGDRLRGQLRTALDKVPAAAELVGAFTVSGVDQVVLLGAPGSGKSTLAALFVQACQQTRILKVTRPGGGVTDVIPVVVPLAGWVPGREGLPEWVVHRIVQDHPALTKLEVVVLLQDRVVLPVLDGLDEMAPERRSQALQELTTQAHAGLRMMITCRSDEYHQAVALAGGCPAASILQIQAVDPADAAHYLTQGDPAGGIRWDPVTQKLDSPLDNPIRQALSTPLMISLARRVYRDPAMNPADLTGMAGPDQVRDRLLSRFLPAVYGSDAAGERAARYLTFLIRHLTSATSESTRPTQGSDMGSQAETDGGRDPDLLWWNLARAVPPVVITIGVTLIGAVLGALIGLLVALGRGGTDLLDAVGVAVVVGANVGLVTGMATGRGTRRRTSSPGSAVRFLGRTLCDLTVPLAPVSALTTAFLLAVRHVDPFQAERLATPIAQAIPSTLDLTTIVVAVLGVLLVAAFLAVPYFMVAGRSGQPRRSRLRRPARPGRVLLLLCLLLPGMWILAWSSLFPASLVLGLVWIVRWLAAPIPLMEGVSPPAVRRADRNALMVTAAATAAAVFAVFAVLLRLGGNGYRSDWLVALGVGLAAGAGMALSSGSVWLSYTVARTWLAAQGKLPWRLNRFLDHAYQQGVLRQSGAAYQIRHDLLRTHLLSPTPPPPRRQQLIMRILTKWRGSSPPGWTQKVLRRAAAALLVLGSFVALSATTYALAPHPLRTFTVGTFPVAVTYAPDGRTLAAGDDEGGVRVWDAA
ncbi:MAG: hypothetical protein QG597_4665, partial [Actinomycetota bacterium]|nr:hypothetical protein [Actinomycetota bacterium]